MEQFSCPGCGHAIEIKDKWDAYLSGIKFTCSQCRTDLRMTYDDYRHGDIEEDDVWFFLAIA